MTRDLEQRLAGLRLLAFDVDGVLTDGRLYYGAEGEALKVFHVRDGVGMKLLADEGLAVVVISAKDSPMLARRMADLGVQHYFPGTKDKQGRLEQLCQSLGLSAEQVAFVGDDMVDLNVMAWCGLGLAPADAYTTVQQHADLVLDSKGGEGVAREVADRVLSARGRYAEAYASATTPGFERKR